MGAVTFFGTDTRFAHVTKGAKTRMKTTIADFAQMKSSGEKITMVTAYDYSTAKIVDASGINSILVGDSLGMVMLGYPDTVSVTMEDMIHHCKAVERGCENALIICDMPFMSYQASVYDAVINAGRLMKEARAGAVKLEGGVEFKEHIRAIVNASIPVCGHIGMTPQSVNTLGGFKVQGKTSDSAKKLVSDAIALCEAGVFAIVLECVPAPLAKYISELVSVPTIGIGAGVGCDGQVLVYQDIMAMYGDITPKFSKQYAQVGEIMRSALKDFSDEVKSGAFPTDKHSFKIDSEVMNDILEWGKGK